MIRPATEQDLPRLLEMCMHFYPMTTYWTRSKIPMDVEYVSVLINALTENGIMNVAEFGGKVVGMIGMIITPFLFNPKYSSAGEIIWWVEPDMWNSGFGRELLKSVEPIAREKGIHTLQMIDLVNSPVQAGDLYTAEGFTLTERIWTKVI